ncbi:MAG: DUF3987 domain-containing protein [Gammaproteobacteria bacterium]|nr:MAG: DUF3987 domain-containing protein [Gammaproteobacteria bacterium]
MNTLLKPAAPPADDWPELIPLDRPQLPPLELSRLPGWAGDFAEALAKATETPPELAAGMVLATCATACARRLRVVVKPGYSEPTNLWLVVGLPPGNRKSAVQQAATAPLVDWEREQHEITAPEIRRTNSERATQQARANELRRKAAKAQDAQEAAELAREAADIEAEIPEEQYPPQLWTSDATPERLGVLLAQQGECIAWLSSEGGIFDLLQGRYSNGILNLDLALKAHNGDPERVDRQGRPSIFLRCPRLTLGMTPQPDVLQGLATKPGFMGRGLLARFLYLLPPSPVGFRTFEGPPMPESVRAAYAAGIRAMLDWPSAIDDEGNEVPHLVRLSKPAYAEWLAFAKDMEASMGPGGEFEHFAGWGAKAAGAAVRVAGILHGIRHAHGEPWQAEITAETMSDALAIISVAARHSLAAHALMGGDPELAAASTVWEWIERGRRERFTVRDAFNALRGTFRRVAKLREALDLLEERGYLLVEEVPHQGPGRPPSPVVRVRPDFARAWA